MKTILIINDSSTARFLLKKTIMESDMESEITEVSDGLDAYAIINNSSPVPDFIITSLNLRKMSGITLLKKLKQTISFNNSKIIILSETGHDAIKSHLEGCPIAGIIRNSVEKEKLLKLLSGEPV